MIDTYPTNLGLIEIHINDGYESAWGDMRDTLYGAGWVPNSVHDGLYEGWPIDTYESKFLARQAVPTDVTIDMAVFGAGDTWQVSATVCIETGGTGKTMDVWMAQIVDHYGPVNFDRNMVRGGSDAVEITLAPDECATVTNTLILDSVSLASPDTVEFLAWAQDTVWVYDPNYLPGVGGANVAEIYQGAKEAAPFEGVLVDNFEDGTTDAWSSVMP